MKKQLTMIMVVGLVAACGMKPDTGDTDVTPILGGESGQGQATAPATALETEAENEVADELEDEVAELEEEVDLNAVATLDEDLQFLREEEKLARDVYIRLYEAWGTQVFDSIAKSEQEHTDRVKELLMARGIEDPVTDDTVGVFLNEDLGNLYEALVIQGLESEVAALTVGATIEDLDMNDIRVMLSHMTDPEAIDVLTNLECGSRNHMRAFDRQLERRGITYQVQYITDADQVAVLTETRSDCG